MFELPFYLFPIVYLLLVHLLELFLEGLEFRSEICLLFGDVEV
jgi:hypothetical protein